VDMDNANAVVSALKGKSVEEVSFIQLEEIG
jgi:hypothetical protein